MDKNYDIVAASKYSYLYAVTFNDFKYIENTLTNIIANYFSRAQDKDVATNHLSLFKVNI
jgi:hypothetical protein